MKRTIRRLGLSIVCALALPAVAAGSASAATATTVVATNVTQTSATLFGVVETGGQATNWVFEYGPSTGYGKITPIQAIPAGQGNVPVSAPVTGLKAGTVYHFQLLAQTTGGPPYYQIQTSFGGDVTFKTAAATAGKLQLRNNNLVVQKNRNTGVVLKCANTSAATNPCNGRLSITTKIKQGHILATVGCGSAPFGINAGQTKRIPLKVTKACLRLIRNGHRQRIAGTLSAVPRAGNRLKTGVTLILA